MRDVIDPGCYVTTCRALNHFWNSKYNRGHVNQVRGRRQSAPLQETVHRVSDAASKSSSCRTLPVCLQLSALKSGLNPFQPKLILVHNTVTGTCRRAYKTCKNCPLCSYVGWHQHSQPNAEKSAQCAKMTTGANGQKACILRTDEKHDAIWHHGAGKG